MTDPRPLEIQAVDGGDPDLARALAAAGLPVDDLTEPGRCFFAYRTQGRPAGFGGFERHGAHVLLRSIVVPEARRGDGLGAAILAHLMAEAAGATSVWLLTTAAAPFFARHGFLAVPRSEAPAEILATRQAAAICPASATLMTRRFAGRCAGEA
ncbi:arsenic resistance N-acetyltransferase ArsN2 [Cereibacter sphaeroides]|uniref:arsenic resistance N-acetyltransferase ArsN2 n=1 Tax=Cereibacter sphaeroides TaxID=1063 RepID=UPI001F2911B5|nr:arsenic resistance N-acetyltransferase ArsN2 [Cereibacter sphaeroides]MCE6950854.1 arsenic resistance N-acetyltransferase ArsN2 [Cereibacter sphaeroides]